jgi:uncharacterized protein (TIGR03437 family)
MFAATFALQALLPAVLTGQIGNVVVTNAASFQAGLPAPLSIGAIFCTGLTVSGVVGAPGTPLPFTLAGVTVTVGGVPAPLFAVADLGGYQQINFQVPWGFQATYPSVNVVVSQNGKTGTGEPQLTSAEDGDFALGAFFRLPGSQYGIFQHAADYSLVTSDKPATAGEAIIGYATGLHPPYAALPVGQPTPASPLYWVGVSPLPADIDYSGIFVNGAWISILDNARILFMGLAPGMVGVYQINFVMPKVAPGDPSIATGFESCTGPFFVTCGMAGEYTIGWTQGPSVLIPVR